MVSSTQDPRFLKGLELFNHKEYFECHEVIEDLWLQTPEKDAYRDLYKGVIQAAAAIYQWDRGILSGARGLYGTSITYLEKYRPEALGLNTKKFIFEMKSLFLNLERWDGRSAVARNIKLTPVLEYRLL